MRWALALLSLLLKWGGHEALLLGPACPLQVKVKGSLHPCRGVWGRETQAFRGHVSKEESEYTWSDLVLSLLLQRKAVSACLGK